MARKRSAPGPRVNGRGTIKTARVIPSSSQASTHLTGKAHTHHQIASEIHARAASFAENPTQRESIQRVERVPVASSMQPANPSYVQRNALVQGVTNQNFHSVAPFVPARMTAQPPQLMPGSSFSTGPGPILVPRSGVLSYEEVVSPDLAHGPVANANSNITGVLSRPPPARQYSAPTATTRGKPQVSMHFAQLQPTVPAHIAPGERATNISNPPQNPSGIISPYTNESFPYHAVGKPSRGGLENYPGHSPSNTEAAANGLEDSGQMMPRNNAFVQTEPVVVGSADHVFKELREVRQIMEAHIELARGQKTATFNQAETLKNQAEALTRMERFIENLPSCNSYSPLEVVESKPGSERKRIFDALRLACVYGKCESRSTGRECSVGILCSKALTNRLPGLKRRSGSPLGVHVSDMARNPSANANAFYPVCDSVFQGVFTDVMRSVSDLYTRATFDSDHADSFFEKHKSVIVGEISNAFRNSRNTKKSELIRNYKALSSIDAYKKYFESCGAIDNGDYRRDGDSPIDKEQFMKAVKKTFGLSSTNHVDSSNGIGKIGISVHQLSFANISLIKSFANPETGVVPTLFEIVPSGATSTPNEATFHEMIELMVTSMSNVLNACGAVRRTSHGWETALFDVYDTFAGKDSDFASYKLMLGTRIL